MITVIVYSFVAGIAGGCVGYAGMSWFDAWSIRSQLRRARKYQHNRMHVPRMYRRTDINTRPAGDQRQPKQFDGMGSVDD